MQREYPEILNCETEPHAVQFLPDCYLYGELAWQVNNIVSIESSNINPFFLDQLKLKKNINVGDDLKRRSLTDVT